MITHYQVMHLNVFSYVILTKILFPFLLTGVLGVSKFFLFLIAQIRILSDIHDRCLYRHGYRHAR